VPYCHKSLWSSEQICLARIGWKKRHKSVHVNITNHDSKTSVQSKKCVADWCRDACYLNHLEDKGLSGQLQIVMLFFQVNYCSLVYCQKHPIIRQITVLDAVRYLIEASEYKPALIAAIYMAGIKVL
jgi:hypothetical protein